MLRIITTITTILILTFAGSAAAAPPEIRLVLQLTVDQLRGDLPLRYADRFGKGGFRYLLNKGVWYTNAQYRHANTETIVGHTSLATGTVPATHGMIGNVWLDREEGALHYNVEDGRYALLSEDAGVDRSSEIDPTQRVAKTEGRSPSAIATSTFSDELASGYGDRAKVFAVSVKDRGAIPLAGSGGKAFWFSKAAGEFVTSTYYYDRYPEWVTDWNRQGKPNQYAAKSWNLLNPAETYQFAGHDDQPWETDFPGYGRVFPHPWGDASSKYFTTLLTVSPAGDELTLDFAKALVLAEGLGQDSVPDYLSISFSSTDYVGHLFGAASLEMEDNLLHLDRTLAGLFAFIDETVGLKHTLIVLSADHGGPEAPGYLNSLGHDYAYVDTEQFSPDKLNPLLEKKLGRKGRLVEAYYHPYVYLDRKAVAKGKQSLEQVQKALAEIIQDLPQVNAAFSSTAIETGQISVDPISEMVRANHFPKRSGDVYVVFRPQEFVNDFDGLVVAATHGSPWRYDRFVPVVFAGNGIKGKRVSRPVTPYDIAVTLANRLGVTAPSGAIGEPLVEVAP
jgi:predicted AlkP superfamily pyrophosphatase or phosphodiesterase